MQTRHWSAIVGLALVACQSHYQYVPVTGATSPAPRATAPVPNQQDASGELPSTAEPGEAPPARTWGALFPFFPFFPIPQVDVGRGYDPRDRPLSPAYGPGGGR